MKKLKIFFNTEIGIFLVLFFTTLTALIIIQVSFFISNKPIKSKNYKSYLVTVEDHLCKCDITYKTDSIRIDSFIYFRSEGMDYQIDTSIVKQVKQIK
jgi:hypothetical protein